MEYTQTHSTISPSVNVKVAVGAGVAVLVPTLSGVVQGRVLAGVITGALTGFAVLLAGYWVRPVPEDGVLTKVEPEPPDDLDAEEALHEQQGMPIAEDW
jgi:hypothetical protein